jgi:hypothetical protein
VVQILFFQNFYYLGRPNEARSWDGRLAMWQQIKGLRR